MGYETNSPITHIWLPLDYDFLYYKTSSNMGFDDFSRIYKDKYGIDLHDVFDLGKNSENEYYVSTKFDLVGAYNAGDLNIGALKSKIARSNAVMGLTTALQAVEVSALLRVLVTDGDLTCGHGFNLLLPAQTVPVNSIDDLLVGFYEY